MNKILKIILLLFFPNVFLIGQYTPLTEEGKFWIYENHENSDWPTPISGHAFTFLGDSTINSLTYKKLYKLNLKGGHNCAPTELPCWSFDYPYQTEDKHVRMLIREDTLTKKIYQLVDSSTGEEKLFFDFSLNIGDTLNQQVYNDIRADQTNLFPGGIVDSIKVIETYGRQRNSIYTYGFWIIIGLPFETRLAICEGLGYEDFGIIYKSQSAFHDYCEGEIDQCNLILSNQSPTSPERINVYPNPSDGIFQIETNLKLNKIKVYSIHGKLLTELEPAIQIDLTALESGIYLLEILTTEGKSIVKKVNKVK